MIFSLMKKDYPIIGLNINEEGKIQNMKNICPWHIEMMLKDCKNGGMNVVHHQHKDL